MTNNASYRRRSIATYVLFGGILGVGANVLIEIFWPVYLHDYRWLHILVIFGSIMVLTLWGEWHFRKQQHTKIIVKNNDGKVLGMIENRQIINKGLDRLWFNPVEGCVTIKHNQSEPIVVVGHCAGDLTVEGTADLRRVSVRGDLTAEGNVNIRGIRTKGSSIHNV